MPLIRCSLIGQRSCPADGQGTSDGLMRRSLQCDAAGVTECCTSVSVRALSHNVVIGLFAPAGGPRSRRDGRGGDLCAGWHSPSRPGTRVRRPRFPPPARQSPCLRPRSLWPAPVVPAPAPPAIGLAPVKPSFDIVRIVPGGSAVLAGRAAPAVKSRFSRAGRRSGRPAPTSRAPGCSSRVETCPGRCRTGRHGAGRAGPGGSGRCDGQRGRAAGLRPRLPRRRRSPWRC